MTALLAICAVDGVTIYSDSGCYDQTGRVVCWSTKVTPLLHLPAIVATRGFSIQSHAATIKIGMAKDFDDAVRRAPEILEDLHLDAMMRGQEICVMLVLMGWSAEAKEWQGHEFGRGFDMEGTFGQYASPFRGINTMPPAADYSMWERSGLLTADGLPRAVSDEEAIAYMEQIRSETIPLGPGSEMLAGCAAGGSVMRTMMWDQGLTMTIVHRWDDQIGEYMAGRTPVALPDRP